MPDTPHAKAFQRAVEVFGSVKALSHWLKVPSDTITTWISGEGVPPRAIFLQVTNFLESAEKEVTPPQSSPASGNSPGIGLGMRILVAETDRDRLMTLGILLRSEGFEVQLLQGGGDVPGTVRTFRPHAVLLDLAMPDRNAYEVATEITQTYGNARPVLIAVTGRSSELDKQAAELCGFDHVVSKPYDPDSLIALLASLRKVTFPRT
jgi:CheY-like chemotaxis protein